MTTDLYDTISSVILKTLYLLGLYYYCGLWPYKISMDHPQSTAAQCKQVRFVGDRHNTAYYPINNEYYIMPSTTS